MLQVLYWIYIAHIVTIKKWIHVTFDPGLVTYGPWEWNQK